MLLQYNDVYTYAAIFLHLRLISRFISSPFIEINVGGSKGGGQHSVKFQSRILGNVPERRLRPR